MSLIDASTTTQPHTKNDSTHSLTNQNPIPHPLPQMPHIAHAARFKLLLLQELWVELSQHLPPFLPHN